MDRSLKRGAIGLSCAWLMVHQKLSKDVHQAMKQVLSEVGSEEARVKARDVFVGMANEKGGLYKDILDEEKRLYGSSKEPQSHKCGSVL